MGAIAAAPGTVGGVEMLEYADESGVIQACGVIGLILDQARKRLGQVLAFDDHAARDKITALGRLVLAQTEQHFVTRIANDEINGNKRRQPDDGVEFGVSKKAR